MCSNNSGKSKSLLKIAERLRLYQSNHGSDDRIKTQDSRIHGHRAAVLICLFEGKDGDLRVILTKRSSSMSSHSGESNTYSPKNLEKTITVSLYNSGEVALPGGKWEDGDESNAATAVREAKEEIGLDPSIVEVVAVLEPLYSKISLQRGITVFPVIGIVWDISSFNPILNASEVESVFDAPLEMFLKNEKRREQRAEWLGYDYLLHFFDYETENRTYTIWALTAAILIKAASITYDRPPAFEEHWPKFWSRSRY